MLACVGPDPTKELDVKRSAKGNETVTFARSVQVSQFDRPAARTRTNDRQSEAGGTTTANDFRRSKALLALR